METIEHKLIQIIPAPDGLVAVYESGIDEDIICLALVEVCVKKGADEEIYQTVYPMVWMDLSGLTFCDEVQGFKDVKRVRGDNYNG